MENVEIKDVDSCKKRFIATIPAERVLMEMNKVCSELQHQVEIPGFRKGKIPREVLLTRYKDIIKKKSEESAVQSKLTEIITEQKLNVILPLTIEKFEQGLDGSLKIEAEVSFIPDVELKEYKNIKLSKKKNVITDEALSEYLKNLQRRVAELVVVEDRTPKDGDHVFVDIENIFSDEESKSLNGGEKNVEFVIGDKYLMPELETLIKGMNKNEEKETDVTFSPDYAEKKVAGKTVHFKLKLNEIKEEKLPELNDDFAKDIGKFNSLDELKQVIKEEMLKNNDVNLNKELKNQILENLVSSNDFPLPEKLVKSEEERLKRKLDEMFGMTKKLDDINGSEKDSLQEKMKERALKNVKGSIIIEKIAQNDKIEVKPEEINKLFNHYYNGNKNISKSEREKIVENEDNIKTEIYYQILEEKVYDYLLKNASISEVE